jgi:V8-like Glu-specific endopeptidase
MKLVLLLISIIFTSCGQNRQSSSTLTNVFGVDNREVITTKQYPWTAIGRVVLASGASCTGTLVTKDLVITAAHCVINSQTKVLYPGTFRFQPNYKNGVALATYDADHIWWGTNDPTADRKSDWAILRLKGNPGSKFGWLGVSDTTIESFPDVISVAGYSKDFKNGLTAGVHRNCSTRNRDFTNKLISHDCDMGRGASGGPVIGMLGSNFTVYGILVSERRGGAQNSLNPSHYDESYANLAIPTSELLVKLRNVVGM